MLSRNTRESDKDHQGTDLTSARVTHTAGSSGIDRLYHFQKFDLPRLQGLVETNRIYLSDPKYFNDPWDCRPFFDLSGLDDPTIYRRHVEWFDQASRKHNSHLPEEEHVGRARRLQEDRTFLEDCIRQMGAIESEIQKRYRVYCLTTQPASTLMWSHYAQNHTGICLEFNSHRNLLSDALKVVYSKSYPALDLTDNDSDTILLPLLTKANDWEYEEEYRLIAQEEKEAVNKESLLTHDNFLQLPDGALISIIVGCLASDSTVQAVRDLVSRFGRSIKIKQAVRSPKTFELAIKDV
jgi:hypothetical protein